MLSFSLSLHAQLAQHRGQTKVICLHLEPYGCYMKVKPLLFFGKKVIGFFVGGYLFRVTWTEHMQRTRPHSLSAFLWALAEFAFLLNNARGAVPSFTLSGSNTLEWWQILTCTAWYFSIRNTQQFWIWVTSHCPMLSHCAINDWSGFVRRQSAPVKGR